MLPSNPCVIHCALRSLQGNEQRIYEYVVRHFLACCSQNAEGHETSVEIEVAGEGFSAQGLAITARNYLDVFPYDKWSDKVQPSVDNEVKTKQRQTTQLHPVQVFFQKIKELPRVGFEPTTLCSNEKERVLFWLFRCV